jgi:NADPH2:quinone reductase
MRAIGVRTFGGPDKLEVLDLPAPHAGAGQIRIRVHAATVNPTDTGVVSGRYGDRLTGDGPWIPGAEAAGIVDEVGEGVDRLAVGDRVLAVVVPYSETAGAYADELVVPAAQAVLVPEGIDLVPAATLPMNGLTAWLVLESLAIPGGGTLAVTGAAGAFGGFVVQLAKTRGLTVVADGKDSDVALLKALGVDEVVERGDDVAARIRRLYPDGVDGVADGAERNAAILPAVRDGGGFATVRSWGGPVDRDIRLLPTLVYDDADRTDALQQLADHAAAGDLTLRVADVIPPEQAAAAQRRLAAGGVRGRLVLDFS